VSTLWVKICGVKSPRDAAFAFEAGADAVGLNFVPSSPRSLSLVAAKALVEDTRRASSTVGEWVGVFADATLDEMRQAYEELGLSFIQLHGHEPPDVLRALAELRIAAYQALRIGSMEDVERAAAYSGDRVLVDAKVLGQLGGTGQKVDVELVRSLVQERRVVLAGGLDPDTITGAVNSLRPFGVDTASGVELSPGVKDPQKTRDFIARARAASA